VKDDRVLLVLRTSDRSGVSGLTMEELKNLAMVNTHVQWEAEKAGKPEMLDDFSEGAGYCRRNVVLRGEPYETWASPCW